MKKYIILAILFAFTLIPSFAEKLQVIGIGNTQEEAEIDALQNCLVKYLVYKDYSDVIKKYEKTLFKDLSKNKLISLLDEYKVKDVSEEGGLVKVNVEAEIDEENVKVFLKHKKVLKEDIDVILSIFNFPTEGFYTDTYKSKEVLIPTGLSATIRNIIKEKKYILRSKLFFFNSENPVVIDVGGYKWSILKEKKVYSIVKSPNEKTIQKTLNITGDSILLEINYSQDQATFLLNGIPVGYGYISSDKDTKIEMVIPNNVGVVYIYIEKKK